jgi:hypothetical protein
MATVLWIVVAARDFPANFVAPPWIADDRMAAEEEDMGRFSGVKMVVLGWRTRWRQRLHDGGKHEERGEGTEGAALGFLTHKTLNMSCTDRKSHTIFLAHT